MCQDVNVEGLEAYNQSHFTSLVIISDTRNIEINENCPFTCCAFSYHTRETSGPGGTLAIVVDMCCAAISDRGFALRLVAKRLHFSGKKKGLAFYY